MLEWLYSVDYAILDAIQGIHTDFLDAAMRTVTHLGDGGIFWLAIGVILCFPKKTRKWGFGLILAVIFGALLGFGLWFSYEAQKGVKEARKEVKALEQEYKERILKTPSFTEWIHGITPAVASDEEIGVSSVKNKVKPSKIKKQKEKLNKKCFLVGFFIPLLGLILYFANKKRNSLNAKSFGRGALFGFITVVSIYILTLIGIIIFSITYLM